MVMALILCLALQLCEWEERDYRKCDPLEQVQSQLTPIPPWNGKGICAPQSQWRGLTTNPAAQMDHVGGQGQQIPENSGQEFSMRL